MKTARVVIALLLLVLPVIAAHAGVFREDFSDGNLNRWEFQIIPNPHPQLRVKDFLNIEDGYLAVNAIHRGTPSLVSLELKTGNPEKWDSYTLACRIRFKSHANLEPPSTFVIEVRYSEGRKVEKAPHQFIHLNNLQQMWIHNDLLQKLSVSTYQPIEPAVGFPQQVGRIPRAELRLEGAGKPMWDRWIPIKIVANDDLFEFYFDGQLVAEYSDVKAGPGTVRFWSQSRLAVHLDDIAITGPQIPDIGPRNVNPDTHLTTTWGEIKNSPPR
ncbi:MAG: hypothetical protein OXP71_06135 [Candidatus Poribacteria bacterium]|nr:hypothetical protein [Candidatus Poribacteria bacterium]